MFNIGKLTNYDGEYLYYRVPAPPSYLVEKQKFETSEVRFQDSRRISFQQRAKLYATIRDISLYTGHEAEELKSILKADYIAKTGEPWFSLSNVDMTTANNFLQHLVDFCLTWGIPTNDSYLDRSPDISRYLYLCLATRTCCVCGKKADVHHSGEDRVGMGRNRLKISHLGLLATALCRVHHTEIHSMPEKEFLDKYHVWPVKLDEYLCKKLRLRMST